MKNIRKDIKFLTVKLYSRKQKGGKQGSTVEPHFMSQLK